VTLTVPRDEALAAVGGVPTALTIAFTDLQGFTAHTQTAGDVAASRLLLDHHRDAARIVDRYGGRIVKRLGDGHMLTFPSPRWSWRRYRSVPGSTTARCS
jgi:class 3 adenylate cyclase